MNRITAGLAALLLAFGAHAADCDYAVHNAGLLTKAGTHCLTRDVAGHMRISGTGVRLNLQGRTITATGETALTIEQGAAVTIRNGSIRGGLWGIRGYDAAPRSLLLLEDLDVTASFMGVQLQHRGDVTLRRVRVHDVGPSTHSTYRLTFGIFLLGPRSHVVDSVVERIYSVSSDESVGISITNAGRDNTITNTRISLPEPGNGLASFALWTSDRVDGATEVLLRGVEVTGHWTHPYCEGYEACEPYLLTDADVPPVEPVEPELPLPDALILRLCELLERGALQVQVQDLCP